MKSRRYNLIGICVGAGLMLSGIGSLIIKGLTAEHIDESGILHENFFLIPIGFLLLLSGVILFLITGIKNITALLKNRNDLNRKNSFFTLAVCTGVVFLFVLCLILLVISNS